MPTKKPRLTITLDPRFYETLSRLAELQGQSKNAVLNDFLMAMHEPLMRTVAMLDAALEAPDEVKRGLRESAEGLERELGALADTASGELASIVAGFERLMGRAEKELDPHVVTRGSGRGKRVRSSKDGG